MDKLKKALLRKRRKQESWFKYIMSVLHLWLGLLSSIIIFIVCLSGSIYAFKQQIENAINHKFVYITPQKKTQISIDSLLNKFEKNYGKPTSITTYPEENKSILISSFSRNSNGTSAYYSPYTGEFLGAKNTSTISFFDFTLDLHRFLLAGDVGKLINGIAVLLFLFMLFSGFIMWLPKKIKQLKQGLLIKWKAKFYRINYDLHKVLGFYSLILLFFIATTGLYVSFHWIKNAIIIGLGGDSIVISDNNLALKQNLSDSFNALLKELDKENIDESIASYQTILSKTDSILLYHGTTKIQFPNDNIKTIQVTKLNKHNAIHFYVPDKVDFTTNGSIRKKELFKNQKFHEQFKLIAKPLHTGEIMGLPSIILYFILSLIGCSLPITGFIIWWKKISKK